MIDVYLEVGSKRVFAGAIDWPGWSRSARTGPAALETLVAYGGRYVAAIGPAARDFTIPEGVDALRVVEQVNGNATTDFGAPGVPPTSDGRPIDDGELDRLIGLLEASWGAFDAVAAGRGTTLRKGPRGGGRELDEIVSHVLGADAAYLARLGGRFHASGTFGPSDAAKLRRAFLAALRDRAHHVPLPPTSRQKTVWAPRYAIRRSAWHALDHAWEIEDRRRGGRSLR